MEKFIKVQTTAGDKFYPLAELQVIEVDNNSATDWYVRGVFSGSLGSFALVGGSGSITTEAEVRKIAKELATSLGLVDAGNYQ